MQRIVLRRMKGIALLSAAMAALVLFWVTSHDGEHAKQRNRDPELYALQTFLKYPWMPTDARERAQEAIAKYANDTLDVEPLLIVATLGKSTGLDQVYLHLAVFDECEDLVGLVVREERHDPNGTSAMFDEHYPVFAHSPPSGVADVYSIPVHIRDQRQRKDEEAWADYCDGSLSSHERESMRSGNAPPASPISGRRCEDTLPIVWISIPDPRNVFVSVYVYDRAGHRSNEVKVLNRLDTTDLRTMQLQTGASRVS